mgnify:CR=1 FL=1
MVLTRLFLTRWYKENERLDDKRESKPWIRLGFAPDSAPGLGTKHTHAFACLYAEENAVIEGDETDAGRRIRGVERVPGRLQSRAARCVRQIVDCAG